MTITSNIHTGLAAWSNSTFTTGQRCSNASNAYQCIVPGSSTSAPTGTGSSINNGGVAIFKWLSAIDYTTVQLWANSVTGTLTQPVVGLLWNDGTITTTAGTAFFTFPSAVTTSSTNTLTLQCAPGESFRDKQLGVALAFATANGVSFTMPNGTGGINYCDFSNVAGGWWIFDGIQIFDSNSAGTSNATMLFGGGGTIRIQNCLFDGYGQPSGTTMVSTFTGTNTGTALTVANCLFVDRTSTGTSPNTLASNAATFKVVNCTFVSIAAYSGLVGVSGQGTSAVTVINSLHMGYASANVITGAGTQAANNCVFTNAQTGTTFTNTSGNVFSVTAANQVISTTTDFRTKAGAATIDAGTTDTTDIPAANDIGRVARPQGTAWDASCCEFVAPMSWGQPANQPPVGPTIMIPY